MVHSLENIPLSAKRDYFIYLLDYGWKEPIAQALRDNYDEMAKKASRTKAVVIKGTELAHFEDEVFSWHHINNEPADDLLPALLITNAHPSYFRGIGRQFAGKKNLLRVAGEYEDMQMVLVPFKRICKNTEDVISVIKAIFADIADGKDIAKFKIVKEMKKGVGHALVNTLIAEPTAFGFGIDLKKLFLRSTDK